MKKIITIGLLLISFYLQAQENNKITENDVIINTIGFSDKLTPLIKNAKTAIVDRLNYFTQKDKEYLLPIEITIFYNNGKGSFIIEFPFNEELRTPYSFTGRIRDAYGSKEIINMRFVDDAFSILDLYKEKLIYQLFVSGYNAASSEISNFSYAVRLHNDKLGTVTFEARNRPDRGYFISKKAILDIDRNSYIIQSQNADIDTLYDFFILPEEKNELNGKMNTNVTLLKKFFNAPQVIEEELAKKKEQKKLEITSQVYNLETHGQKEYNLFLYNLKTGIKKYLTETKDIPSRTDMAKKNPRSYRFTNSYNVHFKYKDQSEVEKDITLISGTDTDGSLFKSVSAHLPKLQIEDQYVMTEATVNNVDVDFARGVTIVRKKKDKVEFKEFIPDENLLEKIRIEILNAPTSSFNITGGSVGNRYIDYVISYEYLNIMGEENISVSIIKKSDCYYCKWK